MKLFQVFALVALLNLTFAYNPFRSTTKSVSVLTANDQDDLNESALQFNFADLLDSKSRMPEIYNMALHEIQLLEEKPLCHRLAAQLTMDSCRDPEDGGEKTYQWGYAHVQSHKIQCFTLALTMCDLESGQIAIPDTCTPFSSSVLSQISRDEKSKFEVSTQNKDACLKSLAPPNPPQYWDTFLNNRQMAMLFCQAARIDMEKDEYIVMHKKMARIIAEFSQGVELELRKIKETMEEQTRATDSYFEGMMKQAQHLKANLQGTLETLSDDVMDVTSSVKSAVGGMGDFHRLLRNLRVTFLQTNAEMAAGHEHALAVTTNAAISNLKNINEKVGITEATAVRLNDVLNLLVTNVICIQERQIAMEDFMKNMQSNLTDMGGSVQVHSEILQQATITVSGLNENLDTAVASSKYLRDSLSIINLLYDLALRIGSFTASLIMGYILPNPTLYRNAGLLLGGLGLGEFIVQLRHCDWPWYRAWLSKPSMPSMPSAVTQLARERVVSSLSTTPVEELVSILTTKADLPTPHVDLA